MVGMSERELLQKVLPEGSTVEPLAEIRRKVLALPRYDLAGDYYEPIWRLDPADDGEYLSRDEVLALFGGDNE